MRQDKLNDVRSLAVAVVDVNMEMHRVVHTILLRKWEGDKDHPSSEEPEKLIAMVASMTTNVLASVAAVHSVMAKSETDAELFMEAIRQRLSNATAKRRAELAELLSQGGAGLGD